MTRFIVRHTPQQSPPWHVIEQATGQTVLHANSKSAAEGDCNILNRSGYQ